MSLDTPLARTLDALRRAEAAAGRAPGSVRLMAVTKTRPLDAVRALLQEDPDLALGENRGQDLRDRSAALAAQGYPAAQWHMIGPLQLNKVKYLQRAAAVHTVERPEQLRELARRGEGWGRVPEVYLQRANGEAQKHGADPGALPGLLREARELGLTVRGLMAMAPHGDPAAARAVFRATAQDAARLGLEGLSMGMSDDYEIATQEGSTLVRIGRALFEG